MLGGAVAAAVLTTRADGAPSTAAESTLQATGAGRNVSTSRERALAQ